jgi:uncharacterized protein (DUF1499 family)
MMVLCILKKYSGISCGCFVFLTGLLFVVGLTGCTGRVPDNLGVRAGALSPCPASPNCVSTQSTDQEHAIEPLVYTVPRKQAFEKLKSIILHMKRAKITAESDQYLHAEFTSALFRFVDDVEFYFDENKKIIQVRSASRIGRSDLGVNRKRIETIRSSWNAMEKR